MLRKITLTLCFAIVTFFLLAQVRPFLDSLKNDLHIVTDDSLRFRVLDELAWTYRRMNVDSALMYGKLAIEQAEILKDDRLTAIAYSTYGVIKMHNNLDDFGIGDLRKSLAFNLKANDQRGISSNFNNLGNAYESMGVYDSAITYYGKSIQIKLETGREESAASTMSNLGLVYMTLENAEKAMEYYRKALAIVGEESTANWPLSKLKY